MAETTAWTPTAAIQHALWDDNETQRALAERLGWDEARLSKILSGKQRLLAEDLRQIALIQNRAYSWYLDPPEFHVMSSCWWYVDPPRDFQVLRPTDNRPPTRKAA